MLPAKPVLRGHALVIGASGGIGEAILEQLLATPGIESVLATRRGPAPSEQGKLSWRSLDLEDEASIEALAQELERRPPLSWVILASGILHGEGFFSERALKELQADALAKLMRVNSIGPALVAKHLVPRLPKQQRCVFACLGARVGSIGDNRAGGWYGYRASKAALVMLVKTLSIELRRTHPQAIALTLHPGTVRSSLSDPFVRPGSKRVVFDPRHSAGMLLEVMAQASSEQSGMHLAYDGSVIEA